MATEKAIRLKRLRMLHDMLLNHHAYFPTVKFNLAVWKTAECCTEDKKEACGTAACALGSAAMFKPFNKMGLKMVWEEVPGNGKLVPEYQGSTGFAAGENFFHITYHQSNYLFSPNNYSCGFDDEKAKKIKISQVVARVEELIRLYSA